MKEMASKKKAAEPTVAAETAAKEKTAKTTKAAAKSVTKTVEKQPAAKKTACKTSVCVEMSGLSVSVADIQNAVKKAIKDKGQEASDLKIYINAAEQAAYYTVDGEGGEECKVDLNTL